MDSPLLQGNLLWLLQETLGQVRSQAGTEGPERPGPLCYKTCSPVTCHLHHQGKHCLRDPTAGTPGRSPGEAQEAAV